MVTDMGPSPKKKSSNNSNSPGSKQSYPTPNSSVEASLFGVDFTAGIYTFEIDSEGNATLANDSKIKNASFTISENTTPSAGEVNAVKLSAGSSSIEFAAKTDGASAGNTVAAIKAALMI